MQTTPTRIAGESIYIYNTDVNVRMHVHILTLKILGTSRGQQGPRLPQHSVKGLTPEIICYVCILPYVNVLNLILVKWNIHELSAEDPTEK